MGKERLFRVLVIAISLRGNKIANFEEEIAESQFAAPITDLVDGGYIEEVEQDFEEEIAESHNKENTKSDLGDIGSSIPGVKDKGKFQTKK